MTQLPSPPHLHDSVSLGHISLSRAETTLLRLLDSLAGTPPSTPAEFGCGPGLAQSAFDLSCRCEALANTADMIVRIVMGDATKTAGR